MCSNMTYLSFSISLHAFYYAYHNYRLRSTTRSHANAVNTYKYLHPDRRWSFYYVYWSPSAVTEVSVCMHSQWPTWCPHLSLAPGVIWLQLVCSLNVLVCVCVWIRWWLDHVDGCTYDLKSMGLYKKDIAPLLTLWIYVFLALSHRNRNVMA